MHQFGYTGLEIVHNRQLQEALAPHVDAGRATKRQGLFQTLKKFLARFNIHLAGNEQELLLDCAETPSFLAEATSSRSYRQGSQRSDHKELLNHCVEIVHTGEPGTNMAEIRIGLPPVGC